MEAAAGAHDLEALLTGAIFDAGLDPDTLDLFSADAISTNGTTIVGLGLHFTDGAGPDIVVWKAVIPEPHTGALVAVGLLAFAVHRRRR